MDGHGLVIVAPMPCSGWAMRSGSQAPCWKKKVPSLLWLSTALESRKSRISGWSQCNFYTCRGVFRLVSRLVQLALYAQTLWKWKEVVIIFMFVRAWDCIADSLQTWTVSLPRLMLLMQQKSSAMAEHELTFQNETALFRRHKSHFLSWEQHHVFQNNLSDLEINTLMKSPLKEFLNWNHCESYEGLSSSMLKLNIDAYLISASLLQLLSRDLSAPTLPYRQRCTLTRAMHAAPISANLFRTKRN